MPTRILIADDHGLMRAGLRSLLAQNDAYEVVGEASNGNEALASALRLRPEVVLMDVSMPGPGGIETTRNIRERLPDVKVVILTVHEDEALLREAVRAGASGYVVKRAVESELFAAIAAALRGDVYVHPSMTRALLKTPVRSPSPSRILRERAKSLTPREVDVLRLLALGYTNRQIGSELDLSVRTVETHRSNIMAKLGLSSRVEMVRWAAENLSEGT